MCINRITISKAFYIERRDISTIFRQILFFLIACRWILPILMFQVIETVGYPDYSCLSYMEPIVIWCYQAF